VLIPCMSTELRTNKPSDVISTLVSICDSKDLFEKELQVLLAQRLLAIIRIALSVRYSLALYPSHCPFDDLPSAEEECRNSEDPIWRGCFASLRSDVEGYGRFQAN
jgi:hypothetical protein